MLSFVLFIFFFFSVFLFRTVCSNPVCTRIQTNEKERRKKKQTETSVGRCLTMNHPQRLEKYFTVYQINVQYLHKKKESVTKWKILFCNNLYIALRAIFLCGAFFLLFCFLFAFYSDCKSAVSLLPSCVLLSFSMKQYKCFGISMFTELKVWKNQNTHTTKVSNQVEQQQ